jgi:voltage-gated potassium channel Kch
MLSKTGEPMPGSKPSWRERLQYAFDKTLARGPSALIGWLAVATLLLIALGTAAVLLFHGIPEGSNIFDVFWNILSQALTPNPVDAANPMQYLAVMFVVTIGSLFMVSILIGILSNEIESRVDALRRGRSKVLENDHTVILGWSPQVFTIVSELVLANENRRSGAVIAVLADRDKVEMEEEIRSRLPHLKNTRVICRSGSPIDPTDIETVSPHTARSIIVLPPDLPEGKNPDSYVIKSVLALANNPNRRAEPYHVVTQIRDPKNLEVLRMVGQKDLVQPVLTNDLIARVVAQTSRQSGLSVVYTELMNFDGDEIYFTDLPASLVGKTYADSLFTYEDSAVLGLQRLDGTILMNLPMDTDLRATDRLFAISADDDTLHPSSLVAPPIDQSAIRSGQNAGNPVPEKCLILGWNRSGTTIICELENYVAKGSGVLVFCDILNVEKQIREDCGRLPNQKISVLEGEITNRAMLEKLKITDYDHVIVLAYGSLEPQEADARTLVTLLHLRDIAERDETPFSIVSEMLDLRNRQLAEVAGVDDFIVSEHLVSLMMSQLSENADLFAVFTDMFDPEGSEIYLKPVSDYVGIGKPVNFYTVLEAARCRNETAIGYRIVSQSKLAEKSYGVHTNPKKSELVTFAPEDKVIVLAES